MSKKNKGKGKKMKRNRAKGMKNSIFTLNAYDHYGVLVFDDPAVGLVREAFVAGADDLLIGLAEAAELDARNFNVMFSDTPWPGAVEFTRVRKEMGGATYRDSAGNEGWLCPAMFEYFRRPPRTLYASVKEAAPRQLATAGVVEADIYADPSATLVDPWDQRYFDPQDMDRLSRRQWLGDSENARGQGW